MEDVEVIALVGIVVLAFMLYFLPLFIGFVRGAENLFLIFIVNFFLGATLIGWLVALLLAFKRPGKSVL